MSDFPAWLRRKRDEVADDAPLSLQTTIAALSQRLWAAESRLDQIGRLHRPDVFGVRCVHCQWSWPCATRTLCDGPERQPTERKQR